MDFSGKHQRIGINYIQSYVVSGIFSTFNHWHKSVSAMSVVLPNRLPNRVLSVQHSFKSYLKQQRWFQISLGCHKVKTNKLIQSAGVASVGGKPRPFASVANKARNRTQTRGLLRILAHGLCRFAQR
jgi:hypothetical protein